jgi:hypothetical protein
MRMTRSGLVLIVGMILLLGCGLLPERSSVSPAELEDLVKRHLVFLPKNDFTNLPAEVIDKDIIFLGEQHNVPALQEAAAQLACYLASKKPVVYAVEMTYGMHPFVEAASLGQPDPLKPMNIPAPILEFNAAQPPERKILMTTLDVEHTIYHAKHLTVLFLRRLAGRSTSETVQKALEQQIAELPAQDTYDKMDAYLKQLKSAFDKYLNTFNTDDQEEILFSMELLDASNRFQYLSREDQEVRQHADKIRYRYFNKTIERALQKARQRDAVLLCRVGVWHVSLDYECEARHFAKECAKTKGNVATVNFVPVFFSSEPIPRADDPNGGQNNNAENDINTIVTKQLSDDNYCYLSLNEISQQARGSLDWSKYFYDGNHPTCDGLLFVKIVKDADPNND